MPKLTRIRLVCVGYPRARFEDVTLNFQDAASRPTDSTFWLRNGGGKSSFLNLFYAVMRPDKRQFLGNKADQKARRLEDYIQDNDRSVVVCEWETDAEGDSLGLPGTRERLLTGVFYEMHKGTGELRRLFFTCKVSLQHPESTLEGLPVFGTDGSRKTRRSLAAFRQQWRNLREAQPHLNISETEQVGEWTEWLEQARLDPELFSYQLTMNQREGGADELFKFKETEDFIDFLLGMALDPGLAEGVRTNIETFRRELKERNETLLPLRELLTGLLARLEPIAQIRRRREEVAANLGQVAERLRAVTARFGAEIEAQNAEAARRNGEATACSRQAEEAHALSQQFAKRAAWLDRHVSSQLVETTKAQSDEARARQLEAQRSHWIWQAAAPLRDVLRFERDARQYRDDLARRHEEQTPLIKQLGAAASALASALLHRQGTIKEEEEAAHRSEKESRVQAERLREESAAALGEAAAAEKDAQWLERQLKESKREVDHLRSEGVIQGAESPKEAAKRHAEVADQAEQAIARAAAEQARLRSEREEIERLRRTAEREAGEATQRAKTGAEALLAAETLRQRIETNATLLRVLQIESLDLEVAAEGALDALRRRLREDSETLVSLRIERAADERALFSLEQTGLLPPTRDAEKALKAVKEKVPLAWSGWTYLSENTPATLGARRKAVQENPLLALGVVVRDQDFGTASAVLKDSSLDLETPIALFRQGSLGQSPCSHALVVGPGSDAHFDTAAAQKELIRKRQVATAAATRIDEVGQERARVEEVLRSVEAHLEACPKGWFRRQQAAIHADEAAHTRAEGAVNDATAGISHIDGEMARLAEEGKIASTRKEEALRSTGLVEGYLNTYGSKLTDWEQKLADARERTIRAKKRSEERSTAARAAETEAESQREARIQLNQTYRDNDTRLQKALLHVQGATPQVKMGKIDQLSLDFDHLLDLYEKTVDEAGLQEMAKKCDEEAMRSRKRFSEVADKRQLSEKEVRKTLEGLDDHSAVERCIDDAYRQEKAAMAVLSNVTRTLENRQGRLQAAEQLCVRLNVTERDRPKADIVPAQAEQEIIDKRAESESQSNRATALEEGVREHLDAAKDASQRAELARRDLDNTGSLAARFSALLAQAAREASSPVAGATDPKAELHEIESRLAAAQRSSERLDEERSALTDKLRALVMEARFRSLNNEIVQRFSSIDAPAVETGYDGHKDNLALHLQVTEQHIADKDQHRELLVQQMVGVAEEGLTLLRKAQRQSVLPATLPMLGGEQFLRISLTVPDDPAERRARLGELVDDWIDSGEAPSAIGLIQQAVQRLARPIRVKLLFPDPDVKGQAVDIAEMSRFSNGERLTCAILLYCTLAQLRARTRGLSRSPSSVLFLDNPIGSASRPKFLELQRDVAREMNVQLIYTTGVNDYEALGKLPNIVRLRNSRVSRATGQKVIEVEQQGDSGIEATQLTRKEPATGPV